jgi:hypoxanthine phosphoribosyltransferase
MKTNSYSYDQRKGFVSIDWETFQKITNGLALSIKVKPDVLLGIARGGLYPATLFSHLLQVELFPIRLTRRVNDVIKYSKPKWIIKPTKDMVLNKNVLIVDEICDSGETLMIVKEMVKKLGAINVTCAVLYSHKRAQDIPDYIGIITDKLVINPWDRMIVKNKKLVENPEYINALKE